MKNKIYFFLLLVLFLVFPFSGMAQTTGAPLNLAIPPFNSPGWDKKLNANFVTINASYALVAPKANPVFSGIVTFPLTGLIQCLHVNTSGVVSGTGSDCGSGGGGAVSSVFGRTGAIAAQSGDYAAFYLPLSTQLPVTITAVAHNFLTSYTSTTGLFTEGQPSFADISGLFNLTTQVTGLLAVTNGGSGTTTPGLIQGSNITITGSWPNQTILVSGLIPVANGGTGTGSPGLVAGTNITVTGSWPNQTITASSTAATAFSALTSSTNTTAAMVVGTGASLGLSGTGTINANQISGVALSGLATGIYKNTTGTGVPSIAIAADFPTLNQNTTGSAATWTTPRLLAGNSVDGSANVAFANKFIVQGTTDTGLSGAQFLGALGTGPLCNTTTTGVLSLCGAINLAGTGAGGVTGQLPIGSVGTSGLSGTAPVTINAAGAIACATCVTASSPGTGIAHFAGATQTVTSSAVSLTADVSGILPGANGGTGNGFFAVTGPITSLKTFTFPNASATVLTTNAVVTAGQGGTGIANTATLTLGTSNQNWATLGTGIVKNTTTTGAISDAANADVIALWTGTCSSSTFLRGDGACQTPAGSGNTTSTSLTTNTIPVANGANSIVNSSITDNGTTVSTTEPISVGASVATTADGVHPSYLSMVGNTTNPSLTANTFGLLGPTTATPTAYAWQVPTGTNVSAGILHVAANSGGISALSISAVSLTADVSGILPAANGGSGVANTATHTLGTSNQNWATLGTGIVKNTTTTGAITDAVSADVIALWSGSCSASTFLRGDGACATGGGGDTITSPNSTLTVGGTSSATTLDVTGATGKILAGATPALTFTPTLGVDNTSAGTLQLANSAAAAHTIWGSGATTSNTILGFTVAPTTGDLISCTTATTTCTLTDSSVVAANVLTAVSPTNHAVILGKGTQVLGATSTGVLGTFLSGQGASSDPTFTTLSAVNPQTATYQVLASDFSSYKTITVASGTFTITLVASGTQPAAGQYINVVNYGTGVVTVARSGQNINGATTSITLNAGSATAPTSAYVISDGTNYFGTIDEATLGTVTSIATTGPIGGGTITGTGTITCATCVVASSPGVGIAHFAGSTQTVTSSLIVAADVTNATLTGTQIASSIALAGSPTTTTQTAGDNTTAIATDAFVTTAVSNAIAGVNPAVAVLAASTANLTGTYVQVGGGIGDTFTVTATGAFTLDGIAINTIGQRVLLKNQTTASQNGVYTATVVGTTGVSPVFTRALDYDTPSDVNNTGSIPVQSGTVNTTTSWLLTSQVTSIGSSGSSLTYALFSISPTTLLTATSPTAHGVMLGEGSQALGVTAAGGANFPLIGQASADPIFSTIAYPTSSAAGGLAYGSSTTALAVTSAGTAKQIAVSGGASAPTFIDFPERYYIPAANCNNTTAGAGWSIPSGGTVGCRGGTNNLGGFITITDTSSTFAQFTLTIPADWDSATRPFISFYFSSGTDTTNGHTVIPQIKVSCPTAGNGTTSDDATFSAAQSSGTVTFGASAVANGFYNGSTVQIGSTQMTGCIAGGLMIVQVGRATDTATGNINFYGADVTFPRLLAVQAN